MWKISYDAPKGFRVNRYFWAVTTFSGLWYCEAFDKWVSGEDASTSSYSTHHHKPKTTKAFIRYLNKHPELKGVEVILVCNYTTGDNHSMDITANWVD